MRGQALDEIYSNLTSSLACKSVIRPLAKPNGVSSDHSVIAISAKLPKNRAAINRTFTFRPITTKGVEEFGELLKGYDWSQIENKDPSAVAIALNCCIVPNARGTKM